MPSTHPRILSTTPLFVVSDLNRSLAFYCGKLGFGDPSIWGEPPCFAMIRRDGFELMLSRAETPDAVRPNGPHGMWDVYFRVVDARAEAASLRLAGVAISREPEVTFYGMLETEILDPDGYRICFAHDTTA